MASSRHAITAWAWMLLGGRWQLTHSLTTLPFTHITPVHSFGPHGVVSSVQSLSRFCAWLMPAFNCSRDSASAASAYKGDVFLLENKARQCVLGVCHRANCLLNSFLGQLPALPQGRQPSKIINEIQAPHILRAC